MRIWPGLSRMAPSRCLAQAAEQGRVEALSDGDAVPAQGLGLLIGDAIAVDRRGAVRRAEAEFLKESWLLVSRHVIQVIEDRVEQAVRMHLSRTQVANDRSALGGHPGGQGLVDFVSGDVGDTNCGSPLKWRSGFGERDRRWRARRSASLNRRDGIEIPRFRPATLC